ncbi:hypothetical protein D4R42_01840 [bacterium]|nr:MAG: hypothetical protein D4R42_01840 [bacterium]
MAEEMTSFKTEGRPAFSVENTEIVNSADPSSEKTDIKQTEPSPQDKKEDVKKEPEEGKNADEKKTLAEHPRWKEREEDWKNRYNDQEKRHVDERTKQERVHADELAKMRKEFDEKLEPLIKEKTSVSEEIPTWFNGDEDQWKELQKHDKMLVEKAREEAIKSVESKSSSRKKAIDEATEFFNAQVKEIEEEHGVTVDRNKLLKIVGDNNLVDTNGKWNYKVGYKLLQGTTAPAKKNDNAERKKIADLTAKEAHAETKETTIRSSKDFENPNNKPW